MIRDSIAKLGGGALHFLAANRINVYVGLSKLVKRTQLLLVDECFITLSSSCTQVQNSPFIVHQNIIEMHWNLMHSL